MRGAVLRHVTSQHYVFSYKLNQGQGQRSRSRSVKINIITKIPYYLSLLCEKFWKNFAKYIGHRGLSVCLSVCLFVCLSSKALQAARSVRSSWFFFQKMSYGHATMQNFFFLKIGWRARSGSPLLWKSDMGHNFWTGSDRDFGLDAKRSLYNSASVRYPPFWRTPSRFYVTWL